MIENSVICYHEKLTGALEVLRRLRRIAERALGEAEVNLSRRVVRMNRNRALQQREGPVRRIHAAVLQQHLREVVPNLNAGGRDAEGGFEERELRAPLRVPLHRARDARRKESAQQCVCPRSPSSRRRRRRRRWRQQQRLCVVIRVCVPVYLATTIEPARAGEDVAQSEAETNAGHVEEALADHRADGEEEVRHGGEGEEGADRAAQHSAVAHHHRDAERNKSPDVRRRGEDVARVEEPGNDGDRVESPVVGELDGANERCGVARVEVRDRERALRRSRREHRVVLEHSPWAQRVAAVRAEAQSEHRAGKGGDERDAQRTRRTRCAPATLQHIQRDQHGERGEAKLLHQRRGDGAPQRGDNADARAAAAMTPRLPGRWRGNNVNCVEVEQQRESKARRGEHIGAPNDARDGLGMDRVRGEDQAAERSSGAAEVQPPGEEDDELEDDDDPPLEAFGGAKLLRTFACCPFMLALIGYLMSLDNYTLFALLLLVAAALAAFFSAASESCGRSLRDIELPQFFCRPAQRAGRQRDERAP